MPLARHYAEKPIWFAEFGNLKAKWTNVNILCLID